MRPGPGGEICNTRSSLSIILIRKWAAYLDRFSKYLRAVIDPPIGSFEREERARSGADLSGWKIFKSPVGRSYSEVKGVFGVQGAVTYKDIYRGVFGYES